MAWRSSTGLLDPIIINYQIVSQTESERVTKSQTESQIVTKSHKAPGSGMRSSGTLYR